MSRSLLFARWGLLSVRFRFSCWWQREWSWGGTSESLEHATIQHSEEWETENQYVRRSTSKIEAGDVDSSGAPAEMRRRSEEKLRGGEALDNQHGSAAERTVPC